MEQREGYKKTKIGWIPEDWRLDKMKKFSTLITKGTTPTTLGFSYQDSGINFVKIESIDSFGQFIPKLFAHISEDANFALKRSILHEHDLLFSIAGALGRVAIVNKSILPANTNQALAIIRLNDSRDISRNYLMVYLKSQIIKDHIQKISVQSAQANVSLNDVNNFPIPLPPLPEQQKIASILTTVDHKISSIDQQIQQTEQLKKGLMEKLLTEGIGHTEFKDTKIGRIPASWEVVKLGEVADFINGRGFKPHEWGKTGLPIIRIQNLNGSDEYNYYSGTYAPKILIKYGDLLFAWSGSRGTSFGPYIWTGGDGLLNYHTWKVEFNEKITRNYLFYESKRITAKVENDAHGASALVHMQKRFIVDYLVSLPPLEEQKQIASILSTVDNKIDILQSKKISYTTFKKGLMAQLLTGQMRVKI